MQSHFDESMMTDSELQDEIAKTFLVAENTTKNQERATPRRQQRNDVLSSGPLADNKLTGPDQQKMLKYASTERLSTEKKRASPLEEDVSKPVKKQYTEVPIQPPRFAPASLFDQLMEPPMVPASREGVFTFSENDVLSGRGGGTNVHPGNRNFRDLINTHRRAYLKAKKNDKPEISKAVVRAIRDAGGRFLKKDEKTQLWFEIGDSQAREKTSQAFRQRAPEMRRLMQESERVEARPTSQEQLRQLLAGGIGQVNAGMSNLTGAGMSNLSSYGVVHSNPPVHGVAQAQVRKKENDGGGMPSGLTRPEMNEESSGASDGGMEQNKFSLQFFKDT
eukprot:scaffold24835_cov113-Cylindrotheca_fusiformis.AAC.2